MEKYGTYEIWECSSCGKIHRRPLGEGLPICTCAKDKTAAPAWMHRFDLEQQEAEEIDHGGHS